jgi:anti-anti-sigma regulatory factor
MLPTGIEIHPGLCSGADVLAFGLSAKYPASGQGIAVIFGQIIDHVLGANKDAPPRLILVDLRQIDDLDGTAMALPASLQTRLKQVRSRLLVVSDNSRVTKIFAAMGSDETFGAVSSDQLAEIMASAAMQGSPASSENSPRIAFTAQELAEMKATGITLDQAIAAIENARS